MSTAASFITGVRATPTRTPAASRAPPLFSPHCAPPAPPRAAVRTRRARGRLPQERLALACAGVCLLALAVPGLAGGRLLLLVAFCLSYVGACTWAGWCRRGV